MKKNLIDKVLLEWSYRCEDGIPDINDPKKRKILEEILGLNLFVEEKTSFMPEDFKQKLIDLVNNTTEKNLNDPIFKSLYKRLKNYSTNILEELKIELKKKKIDPLYKAIYNMAEEFGEADDLLEYLKSEPKPSFKIVEKNVSQNIFDIAVPYLDKPNHMSKVLFGNFLDKDGISIGNVNMGKGELALILLFSDIIKSSKKGDIVFDNKIIEIKGSSSKLALEKRKLASQSTKNLVVSILIKYFDEETYPIKFKSGTTWMNNIKDFYDSYFPKNPTTIPLNPKFAEKNVKTKFSSALKEIYGKDFNIDKNVIEDFFEKPNGVDILQTEITLKLVDEFLKDLTTNLKSSLLFLNPSNGNFIYLSEPTVDQIKSLIDSKEIKIEGFSDELPRIKYIGKVIKSTD